MPQATIIDHSNFFIPIEGYRDLSHLNFKGAKVYSLSLEEKGFVPLLN